MTDTPYNMPPLGLFGKRCRILTGYDKRPFVYRIVNSEWMSNTWCELPITFQSRRNPVRHDHSENVLIVVLDTLIDEKSHLIRVALKDVELMDETHDNAGWISVKNRLPPANDLVIVSINDDRGDNDYRYTDAGWYLTEGKCWIVNNEATINVEAWMPFPKPYKPPKEGWQDGHMDI